jgi:predicted peptidase
MANACAVRNDAWGCAPAVSPAGTTANEDGLDAEGVTVELQGRKEISNVLVYHPPDSGEEMLWPTVLYLHGGSQRVANLDMHKAYAPPRQAAAGEDIPFILVAPQIPEKGMWSDADLPSTLPCGAG